jgi:hypothetical protein
MQNCEISTSIVETSKGSPTLHCSLKVHGPHICTDLSRAPSVAGPAPSAPTPPRHRVSTKLCDLIKQRLLFQPLSPAAPV